MKYLMTVLVILTYSRVFAADQYANDDRKWVVPNVQYLCDSLVVQDWSRRQNNQGSDSSFVMSKTNSFIVSMRDGTVNLKGSDYINFSERSKRQSLANTDLENIELSLSLSGTGSGGGIQGLVLQGYFTFKTEDMNLPVQSTLRDYANGIPPTLELYTEVRVGNGETILRNGPIYLNVNCKLKNTI